MRDLATIFAAVESGGCDPQAIDSRAVRFEPTLYLQIRNAGIGTAWASLRAMISHIHNCDGATASMIAATSWGKFQILGENIYTLCGFQHHIADFINDPLAQGGCFIAFWRQHGFDIGAVDLNDNATLAVLARIYNGPGNVADYLSRLQKARDFGA